jgi:REP element-mobilizing transposase RayT
VTLRVRSGLPSLRNDRVFAAIRAALAAASRRSFRLLQFSVQSDHVHAMVEADGPTAFVRGVQGMTTRVAKAVNRALARHGAVWGDRYHARLLPTPREVRHALVYVLNNFRKHVRGARGLDPCSSARWFAGWTHVVDDAARASPVAMPRTWLARIGWLRHGRIRIDETPVGGHRRMSILVRD